MNDTNGQIFNNNSDLTTEQINAQGNAKTKFAVIIITGIICTILSIGGLVAFFTNPATSKDIWVIIGPIISAGLAGVISFFASGSNKE